MTNFLISSKYLIAALATSLLLTACGGSSSSLSSKDSELNIAATEVIDNTIIPAAQRFREQSKALVDKSQLFCAASNTTEENLMTLKTQWITTNLAWFELLPYRFGPMINSEILPTYLFIDYHRQRGNNATDTVRNNIDTLIASNTEAEYNLTLSRIGASGVGLLALEVLIFEDAENQSLASADIIAEFNNNSRKCQLLLDIGNKLLSRADDVHQGWTTNYRNTGKSYRNLVVNNQLEEVFDDEAGESAIKKIMVSLQEFYDYLAKRNITSNVAQLSSSTWLALEHSLKTTEELLNGAKSTSISINAIMMNNRFEQTVENINTHIETLRTAIEEQNITDTKAAAATLDGNFKRDIPDALNINLGLNFSDGD